MEINKFKENLEHCEKQWNGKNDRIVLATNNPSVGGRCRLPIKNISSGFDWEQGDIVIEVEDEIYSKQVFDKQMINKFIYKLENKLYNKIRGSKSDAECRKYLLEELNKFEQENKSEHGKTID